MNDDFTPRRPNSAAQDEIIVKMLNEVGRNDHKTTSFKLWDTLVITPFSRPEDMFLFMEEDFSLLSTCGKTFTELRTEAQKAAEKKYSVKSNVTLEKIYDIFTKISGITAAGRDRLMARECDLIHHFAFARRTGKLLFDKAKDCKNRIIVTSDSYYPRDVIVKILCDCGYGGYDKLILTEEQNIPDSAPTAYLDAVIKKSGVEANNILHVGGDFSADVEAPIVKGMRALMLQPVQPLMVKSGRIRGFIEEKHLYDMEDSRLMALRCAFGLYAAYGFDVPQNKKPQSDLCGDNYMTGFIILGPLSLIQDFSPETELQGELISAMESNKEIMDGKRDFEEMMYCHFGDFIEKYGSEGCQLPLEFLEKHSYIGDRNNIMPLLSENGRKKWGKPASEPKLAPVHAKAVRKNPVQKLADKLFPEGTRVRELTEGVLNRKKKK
ncbi:hypothetical protein [Ruminococcus flavefaciens]|uniref:Uncharacterized protein n=1 Tax=Ruminococcus flavefaciens 007c TaxID=1341157 RepID=W7UW21_RUMFL|nr:hypothetical protein [Ruminococcus flavefaciens]EWM53070.1 hypothetical protein RF007C_15780 [Ruminococcus flavefaciens 007c]